MGSRLCRGACGRRWGRRWRKGCGLSAAWSIAVALALQMCLRLRWCLCVVFSSSAGWPKTILLFSFAQQLQIPTAHACTCTMAQRGVAGTFLQKPEGWTGLPTLRMNLPLKRLRGRNPAARMSLTWSVSRQFPDGHLRWLPAPTSSWWRNGWCLYCPGSGLLPEALQYIR